MGCPGAFRGNKISTLVLFFIALTTPEMLKQRIEYLQENAVRTCIVWVPEEYQYSSTIDYLTTKRGLL